jgi:GT2 family glycosyltransferase
MPVSIVRPRPPALQAADARHRQPSVAVVVCTHAGAGRIESALRSILAQSCAPDEVLVVDNAPPDSRIADLVRDRFPEARYEVEPVLGLDFARNAALERAASEVVAFLDDDAIAGPDWVGRVRGAFADNPRLVASCCRVTALRLDTEARRLIEANGGLDRGATPVALPRDARRTLNGFGGSLVAWATRIAVGCGMAVRRREALAMGGFDTALDLGAVLPGGGDCDFVWRVLTAGHEVEYLPGATILHDHREDLDSAVRQICGHQRALVALLTKIVRESRGTERLSALMFLGWRLAKPGVRLGKRLVAADPLPAGILLRMWRECWVGLITYPAARRIALDRIETVRPTQSTS